MGHIINANGVETDPEKVENIRNFPIPDNLTRVQRFLGMANYYRKYIKNFAKIARPLHNLSCKNNPFIWSSNCQEAFEKLKTALSNSPVLIFPDFSETFYVTTDASEYAVGAVLSQGRLPDDRPIQYFSKSLTGAQIHYATIHKELLGIILAIEQFRYYLFGRQFVVITDHKPLVALFRQTKIGSRLLRWKIFLSEYDFKIIHTPGRNNHVANCLSRIPNKLEPKSIPELIKENNNFTDILAVTRSKTRASNDSEQHGDDKNEISTQKPSISRKDAFYIDEKRNIPDTKSNFDKIFFLFSDVKCPLRTKLEHKRKME